MEISDQTVPDIVHLRRLFEKFDENGDEVICRGELELLLRSLGVEMTEEEVTFLISRADEDGDGCLNFTEFVNMYKSFCDAVEVDDSDLQEAFNVFDKNGDGFICPAELGKVLLNLGFTEGECFAECQKMINRVDGDGDGQVNFIEFKQMIANGL